MKWVKWGGLALAILVAIIYWKADLGLKGALRNTAAEINRRAPWTVGPGVQIDKADFGDNRFEIHYTLTDLKASEVPLATVNTELKKVMVKVVCSNEAMRRAVKKRVVFSSFWNGSDGREITQVSVTEVDCV